MIVGSWADAIRYIWYLVVSPLLNLLFISVIAAQFTNNTPATLMGHTFNTIMAEFPGVCSKKHPDNVPVNMIAGVKVAPSNQLPHINVTKTAPSTQVSGNNQDTARAEKTPTIVNTSSSNQIVCDSRKILNDVETWEKFIHRLLNDKDAEKVITSIAETVKGAAKISAVTFVIILLIFSLILDYMTLFCAELAEMGTKWIWNRKTLKAIKALVLEFRNSRRSGNVDDIACVAFARRCLDNKIFPHEMDEYQIQEASLAWLSQNAKEGHWKAARSALVEREEFWRYVNQHVGVYIAFWIVLALYNLSVKEPEWISMGVLLSTWLLVCYNTLLAETELREYDIGSFCYYRMADGSVES